jgi:hypothetical protein
VKLSTSLISKVCTFQSTIIMAYIKTKNHYSL